MRVLMDKILKEILAEVLERDHLRRGADFEHRGRAFFEALLELESNGDAMRYLDPKGRIAWKATPRLRDCLSDLKTDVLEDFWQEDA